MSVTARFVRLLAETVAPETYTSMRLAAEQRVKTLHDALMEVAADTMAAHEFAALKLEAESREQRASEDRAKNPPKGNPERDNKPVQDNDGNTAVAPSSSPAEPPEGAPRFDHAKERLLERYKVQVDSGDIAEMSALISAKSPAAKLLRNTVIVRGEYEIQLKGKRVRVIYDPGSGRIVTAVPLRDERKLARQGGRCRKEHRGNPRSAVVDCMEYVE